MPEDKYTCCPNCATVFRVTPEQLGLRGGQVRCGHCKTVFDGVAQAVSLALGTEADAAAMPADNKASPPPAVALRDAPAPASAPQAVLESAAASEAPIEAVSVPDASIDIPSAPDASLETPSAPANGEGTGNSYDDRFSTTTGQTPGRVRTAASAVAAAVLVLAILGQAIFHFRDAIAARWPPARPALAGLCDLAGCAIRPLRDAAMSYLSIEASDLQADPAHRGLLILTATLRNRAAWALSYPYLELTLTDAQDRVVVRRALAPADYAGGTADLPAGIAANGEITLKVFIDASATAQAGYRLYMFYP